MDPLPIYIYKWIHSLYIYMDPLPIYKWIHSLYINGGSYLGDVVADEMGRVLVVGGWGEEEEEGAGSG